MSPSGRIGANVSPYGRRFRKIEGRILRSGTREAAWPSVALAAWRIILPRGVRISSPSALPRGRHADRRARQMDVGGVMVDDCMSSFGICEAPGGAVKTGGIVRSHSQLGLMEMVHVKYAMRSKA
jgi:hypothetical protein